MAPAVGAGELLPQVRDVGEEFRSKQYWDGFFTKRGARAFEWYSEWAQLRSLVRAAVGADEGSPTQLGGRLLVVGCGNSELSAQLYDDGFQDITNIDFSKVCISDMMREHVRVRPRMRWLVMDATAMKFSEGSFDTLVDKGALDALMGEPGAAAERAGNSLLAECARVCAPKGRILVVSLLQDHVLEALLRTFRPFLVVAQAQSAEHAAVGTSVVASVELIIPKKGAGARVSNAEQQHNVALLVRRENAARDAHAATGGMPPGGDPYRCLHPGRTIHTQLGHVTGGGRGGIPRFSACVVDLQDELASALAAASLSSSCPPERKQAAVFLVPQGREHEWLFGSEEGRARLSASCAVRRLVLISLGRGHEFGTAQAVQAELSPLVLPLLPLQSREAPTGSVPFLTTADGLGRRTLVAQMESALSGGILVEDVTLQEGHDDGEGAHSVTLRRLVFSQNPNLVQSEARLLPTGHVDTSHLACEYHTAIVAGLAVVVPVLAAPAAPSQATAWVIGLGGGALPTFLALHLPLHVHVVELDASVAEVARAHFAFTTTERLSLALGDGLLAVEAAPAQSIDALVIDAGSNDASLGMSCPPAAFLAPAFLQAAQRALRPGGALVVNVVARSQASFDDALAALRGTFASVWQADAEDDVNRVIFALAQAPPKCSSKEAADALLRAATKPWDATSFDLHALCAGVRELTTNPEADELD